MGEIELEVINKIVNHSINWRKLVNLARSGWRFNIKGFNKAGFMVSQQLTLAWFNLAPHVFDWIKVHDFGAVNLDHFLQYADECLHAI